MIRRLARCVREYKWIALISPLAMIGEVFMEVQIPDVDPIYKTKKSNSSVRKTNRSEKIPEIKSSGINRNPQIKKVIITAIVALVMILLFILSVVLHNHAKTDDNIVAYVDVITYESITCIGGLNNGR